MLHLRPVRPQAPITLHAMNPSWRSVSLGSQALAATHDPNALVDLLRRHPYHLDTLLNLFYIYTHTSNFTAADSFLQRMLFVLESAFHPWFDVTSGTCRLEYSLEENKTIFQVLFR